MENFKVYAPEVAGALLYFRCGLGWPRGRDNARTITVVPQDEDPEAKKPPHLRDDPWTIGRKTLAALRADKILSVVQDGDPITYAEKDAEIAALRAQLAELVAQKAPQKPAR